MSVLESVIGWLAPAQCLVCGVEGASLCNVCTGSEVIPFGNRCWRCESLSPNSITCTKCKIAGSPRHIWVVTDYGGAAKGLVQKYKFGHLRASAESIAQNMYEKFLVNISDEDINKLNYLVVPVPTASSRVRERGFDHSTLLAKKLSAKINSRHKTVLGRTGQCRQVGAKRSERIKQVQDIYFVHPSADIKDRNILLIDDVITTGATISATSRLLRNAGASRVDALVFAKKR
jgi:ComF family protein